MRTWSPVEPRMERKALAPRPPKRVTATPGSAERSCGSDSPLRGARSALMTDDAADVLRRVEAVYAHDRLLGPQLARQLLLGNHRLFALDRLFQVLDFDGHRVGPHSRLVPVVSHDAELSVDLGAIDIAADACEE